MQGLGTVTSEMRDCPHLPSQRTQVVHLGQRFLALVLISLPSLGCNPRSWEVWNGVQGPIDFKIFFFNVDHFKVFIEFVTILFLFYVLAFWLWGMRISTPRPGVEPASPASEGKVLTTEPPGKSRGSTDFRAFQVTLVSHERGEPQQRDYEKGLWGRTTRVQVPASPVTGLGPVSLTVKAKLTDDTSSVRKLTWLTSLDYC